MVPPNRGTEMQGSGRCNCRVLRAAEPLCYFSALVRPIRLTVRTRPSQGRNTGSIPVWATSFRIRRSLRDRQPRESKPELGSTSVLPTQLSKATSCKLGVRTRRGMGVAILSSRTEEIMVNRDDELPREGERPQCDAYDGTGDEHGEPREFRYGSGFDKPERGRWAGQEREEIFTRPYDDWSSPGYVFYAGKGYHREFVD